MMVSKIVRETDIFNQRQRALSVHGTVFVGFTLCPLW